jgi:hypothetical protein
MLVFAWQAGRCSISRPNCLWRHSRVSAFNRLRRKKKLSLVAVSGCPWCQGIKNKSLVAVSCCDWCILGCRAGSMRKETTLCTCQALMLFTRLCGCCKHEFCCAVGCAAALASPVAQIRMMHVCLYIKRPDPATQTWGFLGETAARLACVSYVIRRRRCYNWFVVSAGDGCCNVAGAAGQCLISYGATCRWKGIACGGTRAGCYARKLCCTRAHTWRYVWEIFCLSS